MAGAAFVGSRIYGSFNTGKSDHNGHYDPFTGLPIHPTGTIDGTVTSGSGSVFINGRSAAFVGSTTDEPDVCCSAAGLLKHGAISEGSSSVFINGKPAARIGDSINTHLSTSAEVSITSGSGNVIIG